jgi:hypothetical protein
MSNTPRSIRSIAAATFFAALLGATQARADVIGPDEQACQGRAAGATCITPMGGAGVCQTRTVPVGPPMADVTRMAIFCAPDGDASTATDSGVSVGSEPPAAMGGCRCSVVGSPVSGRGALGGLLACAALGAITAITVRRRRR